MRKEEMKTTPTPPNADKTPPMLNEHVATALKLPVTVHAATLRRALKSHFGVEMGSMTVSVADRTVTLEGLVDTWSQKELAGRTLWKAPGVLHVENNLKVRYEGRLPVSDHTFTMAPGGTMPSFSEEANHEPGDSPYAGLQRLFANELEDLYATEKFLVEALPRFIREVTDVELCSFFETYLHQIRSQLERLDRIFHQVGEVGRPVDYHPMSQLYERTKEVIDQTATGPVMDLALLSAVLKFNQFQMAAYGMVGAYAQTLGKPDLKLLLDPSLEDKERAGEALTRIRSAVASGWHHDIEK